MHSHKPLTRFCLLSLGFCFLLLLRLEAVIAQNTEPLKLTFSGPVTPPFETEELPDGTEICKFSLTFTMGGDLTGTLLMETTEVLKPPFPPANPLAVSWEVVTSTGRIKGFATGDVIENVSDMDTIALQGEVSSVTGGFAHLFQGKASIRATGDPANLSGELILYPLIKLLIPSSARTANFKSLLVIFNLGNQPNNVEVRARRTDGSLIGSLNTVIPVGGRFRSTDILGDLGAALNEFGPITVESTNGLKLGAVSQVSSAQGTAGFFRGINVAGAWTQGVITEVIDTGDSAGTFRTNVGVNNVSDGTANVSAAFFGDSGAQVGGPAAITVPPNGMTQVRVTDLIPAASGLPGFLLLRSDQLIHAWASKIENGTNDPSFQIGIPTALPAP